MQKIKVRVLRDCAVGACNTVAEVDKDQLDGLVADGAVDPNPHAVAAVTGEPVAEQPSKRGK